jgi:hypothetical protein
MTLARKGHTAGAEADLPLNATQSEHDYWQERLSIPQAPHADTDAIAEKSVVQSRHLHRWWYLFLTSEQERQMHNTLLQEFVSYRAGEPELSLDLLVSAEQMADTIAALASNSVLYYRVD